MCYLRDLYWYIITSEILVRYVRLPRYIMLWLPGYPDELHGDRGVDRQLQPQVRASRRS